MKLCPSADVSRRDMRVLLLSYLLCRQQPDALLSSRASLCAKLCKHALSWRRSCRDAADEAPEMPTGKIPLSADQL